MIFLQKCSTIGIRNLKRLPAVASQDPRWTDRNMILPKKLLTPNLSSLKEMQVQNGTDIEEVSKQ